jgi:methyl-accepting chemotaxis protein
MKTLRATLLTLIAAGVLALGLFAATSTAGNVMAQRAVTRSLDAKDLVADILPPPLYLIELRLVLGMAVEGALTVPQAEAERTRLVKEYTERVAFWTAHPPYGLEALLLGPQHADGQRFI